MPDDLAKVVDGEPLRIPAAAYNAFIDAAKAELRRKHNTDSGDDNYSRDLSIITIRNDSGSARSRFEVLGLDAPFITNALNADEFKASPNFKGVVTTSAHVGKFAILLEPLAVDAIGDAMILGVSATELSVTDAADTHADVEASAYKLKTATTGAAEILWKESGTGAKWGYVRLGGGSGGNAALVTITSATVTASRQPGTVVKGGSGSCKVQNYYTGQSAMVNGNTYYAVRDGEADGLPLYHVALKDCP